MGGRGGQEIKKNYNININNLINLMMVFNFHSSI